MDKGTRARIVWHILEISRLLQKHGELICQEEGITVQQWLVLLHLSGEASNIPYFDRDEHVKPVLASELAEALNVSRPNITNLINALLQKNLIQQSEDADDRRRKRLQLAPKGWELLERLEPGRAAFNANLMEELADDQVMNFLSYLESCNRVMLEHFSTVAQR